MASFADYPGVRAMADDVLALVWEWASDASDVLVRRLPPQALIVVALFGVVLAFYVTGRFVRLVLSAVFFAASVAFWAGLAALAAVFVCDLVTRACSESDRFEALCRLLRDIATDAAVRGRSEL